MKAKSPTTVNIITMIAMAIIAVAMNDGGEQQSSPPTMMVMMTTTTMILDGAP